MKVPVCDICRLTPVKCKLCEGKITRGELTEADFIFSRAISAAKADITLERAFDLGKVFAAKFKGEVTKQLEEVLGKPVVKVSSGKEIMDKLGIKTRPSKVFIGGEEKERVALSKSQLESDGIDSVGLKRFLNYFNIEASIV